MVVAHHTTKASQATGERPVVRGSSALVDGARFVATLTPDETGVAFDVTKTNYGTRPPTVRLRRTDGGGLRAEIAPEAPRLTARARPKKGSTTLGVGAMYDEEGAR